MRWRPSPRRSPLRQASSSPARWKRPAVLPCADGCRGAWALPRPAGESTAANWWSVWSPRPVSGRPWRSGCLVLCPAQRWRSMTHSWPRCRWRGWRRSAARSSESCGLWSRRPRSTWISSGPTPAAGYAIARALPWTRWPARCTSAPALNACAVMMCLSSVRAPARSA